MVPKNQIQMLMIKRKSKRNSSSKRMTEKKKPLSSITVLRNLRMKGMRNLREVPSNIRRSTKILRAAKPASLDRTQSKQTSCR